MAQFRAPLKDTSHDDAVVSEEGACSSNPNNGTSTAIHHQPRDFLCSPASIVQPEAAEGVARLEMQALRHQQDTEAPIQEDALQRMRSQVESAGRNGQNRAADAGAKQPSHFGHVLDAGRLTRRSSLWPLHRRINEDDEHVCG